MPRALRPEVALARQLRKQMSYPEVLLWQRLRGCATGLKFRKQHPVGPYIADFCCLTARLVIEVDGEIHAKTIDRDKERDRFISQNGFCIIRINAADILKDADGAASSIASLAARPLHQPAAGPPPRSGEDQE